MWLGEQITEPASATGLSLLIFSRRCGRLPHRQDHGVPPHRRGWTGRGDVLAFIMLVVVWVTVAITVAARRIPIQIPRKVMGRGLIREGRVVHPLRSSAG